MKRWFLVFKHGLICKQLIINVYFKWRVRGHVFWISVQKDH